MVVIIFRWRYDVVVPLSREPILKGSISVVVM